jgi:AraC-like DNA-binding protein
MNESDALSEVLRGVHLTGAIFLRAELSEPWGFQAPPAGDASALLAPGTEHLVPFHLVTEGKATVRVAGCEPVHLEAGEIVVLPRGDAHVLASGAPAGLVDTSALLPAILEGSLLTERGGGGGPVTRFVCGYVGCDRQAEKLFLSGLPGVFKVRVRTDASAAWIESAIRHLVLESETSGPGSRALRTKLAEALFIETLRRHMAQLRREDRGWLAAARDPAVGRALWSMHREPTRAWTVADLAKRAGVSRTVFARRFGDVLGQTPLAYLASWRLWLAATRLRASDDSVIQVALGVGYESEAAFNRAFKREFGLPPARYRKRERTSAKRPTAERTQRTPGTGTRGPSRVRARRASS